MNSKEITKHLLEHLSSISIEQFEKELEQAGIETCSDIVNFNETFLQYEVFEAKISWGDSLYAKPQGCYGVTLDREVA